KAQQMYGGHGYINEWGMGQFVRDARITMIYEGANGIQALDLVGRKLGLNGGRAVMAFFNEVGSFCAAHKDDAAIGPFIAGLSRGLGQLQEASMWLMQNAMQKPDNAGAGSTPYMHLFGLVAMGYMWARMAKAANDNLAAGANGSTDRMNAKLTTARFYFEQLMPETTTLKHRVTAGADSMMALPADMF
ncbi:MAG: acyl-CoA dehydrogenase, partial [Alphaproteobacteria bacterium]